MSNKVSFEGIGEVNATFYADEGTVIPGQLVKLVGDGKVGPCVDNDRFCGVAVSEKTGCAAVQVAGFAEVLCTDEQVTAGYVKLSADGKGGVKKNESGGVEYLVLTKGTGTVTLAL